LAGFHPRKQRRVTRSAGDAPAAPAGTSAPRPSRRSGRGRGPTYFRIPVALKFAAFIVVLVVAITAWQTLTATGAAGARLEDEINESGVTLASALAALVDPRAAVDPRVQEELKASLQRFSKSRGAAKVLNIVVYDPTGQALATARGESRFSITTGEPVSHAAASEAGVDIREFSYEGTPVRSFSKGVLGPSAGEDAPVGRIEVYLSAEQIERSRRELAEAMTRVSVVACLAAVLGAYLLSRFLTRPIRTLVRDMRRVSQGDLEHESKVRSSDELGDLAHAFNAMTSGLQAAQETRIAQKALEHELSLASGIQTRLLPASVPRIEGFEIFAYHASAKEVGGDYYDFIRVGAEGLGLVVADVSGKGVPASLVMTMTRSLLRAAAEGETSPGRTVETVNRLLGPDMTAGMFVTLVYALLDAATREVKLVRCGHNAPLFFSPRAASGIGDGVTALQPRGLGIGIDRSGSRFRAELQTQTIDLQPGDALLLYTDGVVEAKDRDGKDYGDERLRQIFAARAGSSAAGILEAVLADVASHRRGAEPSDDLTLLVLKAT